MIKNPEECSSMAEVRAGVDEVDAALVRLLDRRFGYMAAAAGIKGERGMVRDEARKAQVIANVSRLASEAGLPAGLAPALWEMLVETSIAYELALFDERSDRAA